MVDICIDRLGTHTATSKGKGFARAGGRGPASAKVHMRTRSGAETTYRDFLGAFSTIVRARGAQIYHEGDTADSVYFVKKGYVRLYWNRSDGRRFTIAILPEGAWFGGAAAHLGIPHMESARAMTNVTLCCIPNARLAQFAGGSAEISLSMVTTLAERLRLSTALVRRCTSNSLATRMAELLIQLSSDIGTTTIEGWTPVSVIPVTISQSELAEMALCTRSSANRLLNGWRRAGLIDFTDGQLVICDVNGLRRLAEGGGD